MGTRGLTVVVQNGTEKVAQYGQWDHYPAGQGAVILGWLNTITPAELVDFRQKVHDLKTITDAEIDAAWEEIAPGVTDWMITPEQSAEFKSRYPGLDRDHGGQILPLILSGDVATVKLSTEFAQDSLFCEWAYVVDLDTNRFEVYKGFITKPHADGRFARTTGTEIERVGGREYAPVRLVASWPLDGLPETFGEDEQAIYSIIAEKDAEGYWETKEDWSPVIFDGVLTVTG
jgi:hypothetical protein